MERAKTCLAKPTFQGTCSSKSCPQQKAKQPRVKQAQGVAPRVQEQLFAKNKASHGKVSTASPSWPQTGVTFGFSLCES